MPATREDAATFILREPRLEGDGGGGGVSACTNRFRISLKIAGYDMQGLEGEGGEFLDPITQPKNFL